MRSKYFKIEELVSENVYKKYRERAWSFISGDLIKTLDALREHFNKPITVNNWLYGGSLEQRGLRANKDRIVEEKKDYYLSQHCLGNAVDFNVKGLSVKEVYDDILKNKHKFPYLKRIENIDKTPTWIHIDCANVESDDIIIF